MYNMLLKTGFQHRLSVFSFLCVNITFFTVCFLSAHPLLPLSLTPGLKPNCFTDPTPAVSLLPPGLPSLTIARTVSSELLDFCF